MLALVVAGVVLPPLYDDGWVLTTVRSFPSLGYFSDYFANEATPQPLGFWWSWLAQGWLQPIWLPAIGLRLVPLAICFAVWLVARRILAARLPGDARAPAMWVAAAVYVVSASSWLVTLRPEPVVALLLALQYALVVRFAETPTIVPLAWSGIVSVLALTAHQTGLAVAVASLAIVPGVVAWIGRNRRRWLDLGLLAAGLTMMLAILLTLSSNLAMWLDSRASFAEGIAHDRLLDEVARIATLNAGLVTPLRRLSVALLAIGLVGFLVRPRGWLPRPLSTVGLAAVLSVAGLALTVSKWPWHYGALAPSAAVLAGLTAAWLWGGSREQVSAWRVAGFGFAIAGASFWAALSQELWAPTSLAGLTPLAIVRAREWGPLSTDELLLWVLLAALAVALAVIVRTRQRRSLVALSVFSAACLGLVTALSVGPLVVDAAVSGTPSWIGQTAAVAAGNTCGAAGSTGFAVPVDPQPLAGRTGPPLGAGAAVAEATPPLAPPVPGLAVFVPAGGSDPTRPVASPWQELPMGVTARIWLRTGPGFVDATVQTASVDGGDLTEQRVSTPAGVPAWRLIEVEAASMPRILRTSWTPAQSSVSGATAAVSSSRTEPLNSLTTTAWVNPATYLYTPCLLPPSIAGGIVADVQWSVGLPDILGRSLAFEGVVTEMDCQGVALSADRLCATTVSLPTSPSLTVTSIPIQQ